MGKIYILYNPMAGNGYGFKNIKSLYSASCEKEILYLDITKIKNFPEFLSATSLEDEIVISGGDGTLNHFVNCLDDFDISQRKLYYHASGSGNDFAKDINLKDNDFSILNPYIQNLPTVYVKGKSYKFINGVGFGLDGYCCEEGDRIRKAGNKKLNYTKIAISGLLFHYKRTKAEITVDGVSKSFKDVWIAPTMLGHYYGGGIMPCPRQDRFNKDGTVSLAIMHTKSKLLALLIFPKLFKGTHEKIKSIVEIVSGRDITVSFDKPTALQIDGETIKDVLSYKVSANTPSIKPEIIQEMKK